MRGWSVRRSTSPHPDEAFAGGPAVRSMILQLGHMVVVDTEVGSSRQRNWVSNAQRDWVRR